MAKDDDKQAVQAAAIEEIRAAIYEPKTTLPNVRRRVGQILMKLREQTGETPEPGDRQNQRPLINARGPRSYAQAGS